MKRIALQLLLSLAMILQGVSAFGASIAQPACCCDGHAAHAHCQYGHGMPCKSNCALHCIGCTTAAFVAMPTFAVIAPAVSADLPSRMRAATHTRDDLPPIRPPIA
ncbi:MAG TPA: hypothetical protein PKD77_11555 [Rudaea sp.]|jgi:hypothetical protein|nr:hypothetical protein [Rudaea sp.]